jgi:hypothetical protein
MPAKREKMEGRLSAMRSNGALAVEELVRGQSLQGRHSTRIISRDNALKRNPENL